MRVKMRRKEWKRSYTVDSGQLRITSLASLLQIVLEAIEAIAPL